MNNFASPSLDRLLLEIGEQPAVIERLLELQWAAAPAEVGSGR